MKRPSPYSAVCLFIASAFIIGCGPSGPTTHPVTGKLTKGGQPLDGIQITFSPSDGGTNESASGNSSSDGSFTLYTGVQGKEGASVGKYKVVLKDTQAGEDRYAGGSSADGKATDAPKDTSERIPEAWTSAETSPKEVEVTSGSNTIDIAVE